MEEEKKWGVGGRGGEGCGGQCIGCMVVGGFGFFVATAWQYYQQGFPMLWGVMKLES